MNAYIALFAALGLIGWLLRQDMKWRGTHSWPLFLPGAFLAIQGSRPVSFWVGFGGSGSDVDGNPINVVVFVVYIAGACVVLNRRGMNWSDVINRNRLLMLIYGYFVLSAVWSELPLVSLKRIVKDFSCVLLALVVISERDPVAALRTITMRVMYVLFPLSIVFGRYFPHLGKAYTNAGDPMFTGVADQKNTLGLIVYVFGLMAVSELVEIQRAGRVARAQVAIRVSMLLIGLWLLVTCDSKTSLLCLLVGVLVFWGVGRLIRMKHGKQLLTYAIIGAIVVLAADETFGISERVAVAAGRDASLTGRTDIWRAILDQDTPFLLGCGFYIFWDTDKGQGVVDAVAGAIKSAHNGYLETYMDGGVIGLCLLVAFLLWSGRKLIAEMFDRQPGARIGFSLWFTGLIHNLSEASFFRLNPLWFMLIFVSLNYRRSRAFPPGMTVKSASVDQPSHQLAGGQC